MTELFGLLPFVGELIRLAIALILVFVFLPVNVLLLVYLERKVAAFMQDRLGPYHTGKWGLLQSLADAIKLLAKEDFQPAAVDRVLFFIAPIAFFSPVAAAFIPLPFDERLTIADLNVGLVFVMALGTTGFIGVIAAGWSSNNKYSLLGCFRACAQMISYEIPMILAVVGPVMLASSLSLSGIVSAQGSYWFALVQPLAFAVYFTCALAETNRNPFDLPEAESELVAGFLTEYSGIRWAMFFLGEYGNMIVVSAIATTLFLGGWQGPLLPGLLWFIIKVYFLLFVFIWIRATLPRLRADQLMELSWKVLIPLTLANIFVVGTVVVLLPNGFEAPLAIVNWLMLGALIVVGPRILARKLASHSSKVRSRMGFDVDPRKPALPPGPARATSPTATDGSGR